MSEYVYVIDVWYMERWWQMVVILLPINWSYVSFTRIYINNFEPMWCIYASVNTLGPSQNGRHFAYDIFKLKVMKIAVFWVKFHWRLFLKILFDSNTEQAKCHYLNQWWNSLRRHVLFSVHNHICHAVFFQVLHTTHGISDFTLTSHERRWVSVKSVATPPFVQSFVTRTPEKRSKIRVTESLWVESTGNW